MQVMQQEIRRLSKEGAELQEQLREHKVQVGAVEVFTPTIREYSTYAVQRHHIDPSALLDLQLDDSATLTQRLAALEDVTRRLQDEHGPLSQRVQDLESSVWLQTTTTNAAISRMDHLEVYHHELWKGARDKLEGQRSELSSIRVEQERFEAEVKETMKELKTKSMTTPAALEEHLTQSITDLTTRVKNAEETSMTILKSVTTLSEQYVKISCRQSTLENILLQHFRNKMTKNAEVDATKGTSDIGNTASKGTLIDIGTNTELNESAPSVPQAQKTEVQASNCPAPNLLSPNPVVATRARSPSPFPAGNRKSPRLIEKEYVPPSSKS